MKFAIAYFILFAIMASCCFLDPSYKACACDVGKSTQSSQKSQNATSSVAKSPPVAQLDNTTDGYHYDTMIDCSNPLFADFIACRMGR